MIRKNAGAKLAMSVFCIVFFAGSSIAHAVPRPSPRPENKPIYLSYKQEVTCLAEAVYFEARGEPVEGQKAVARVVLNRVDSAFYPDTICDVVYQNDHMKNACQFSFACDDIPKRVKEFDAFKKAQIIATKIFECDQACREREHPVGRSTHYHADFVHPRWANKLERTGKVGRHIFYYTASM